MKNLGDITVIAFLMISAFLFWYNVNSIEDVVAKVKRRGYTLLMPYIFWNLIGSFLAILLRYGITGFASGVREYNWIRGVFLWGGSPHFWYIFILMVTTLIAPILYVCYSNRFHFFIMGSVLLAFIYFNRISNQIIRLEYIIFIIVGYISFRRGYLLIQFYEKKHYRVYGYLLIVGYVAIYFVYEYIISTNFMPRWIFYVIRSALFIFAGLILMKGRFMCNLYKYSFWIYASHYYIDDIISGVLTKIYIYRSCTWFFVLFGQIIAWGIAFVLSVLLGKFLEKINMSFYSILIGRRIQLDA